MKDKKSCLKALAWLELAEGYLKPCHQAPLNIKQMYVLSLSCFLLTSWIQKKSSSLPVEQNRGNSYEHCYLVSMKEKNINII